MVAMGCSCRKHSKDCIVVVAGEEPVEFLLDAGDIPDAVKNLSFILRVAMILLFEKVVVAHSHDLAPVQRFLFSYPGQMFSPNLFFCQRKLIDRFRQC